MYHRSHTTPPQIAAALMLVAAGLLIAAPAVSQETPESTPEAGTVVEVDAQLGTQLDRATRTLVDPADRFPADTETIYCLTRIRGLEAPTTVTHAWYHEGEARARVSLKVGSADWRTWSSKSILPAWTGRWEVKVLDESGKVLDTAAFVIE